MNTLDVVFCNDPQIISDCYVEPPLTGSDHNIVGFDFLLPSHISDSLTDDITDSFLPMILIMLITMVCVLFVSM